MAAGVIIGEDLVSSSRITLNLVAVAHGVEELQPVVFHAEGLATFSFTRRAEFAMDPTDLLGTRWQLASMGGGSPAEGSRSTSVFQSENRLTGEAGCRGYVTSCQADGDDIRFPATAMMG